MNVGRPDRREVSRAAKPNAWTSANEACDLPTMTAAAPGPLNLITDVPGLKVGQAEDAKVRTGVTVILPDAAAVAAVDVRGGAPGTRETDALAPEALVETVDAVVIAGGSVYGLAAADAVAAWLGAEGRGYGLATGAGVPPSPIVPAAILYDLANGGDKAWGLDPPYRSMDATEFWRRPIQQAARRLGSDRW